MLYGDNNNWFAAYAYWLFKIYGHRDVRLMNGGRVKWLSDDKNPLTTDRTGTTPVSNHRMAAPNSTNGMLCGSMGSRP